MKQKLTYNILFILTVITLFSMSLNVFGQEKNSAGAKTEFAYVDPGTEPVSGYWEFTSAKTDIYSGDKNTNWVKGNDVIIATSSWIDILKIEHTISSSFKWDEPSQKLTPGSDNRISGNYINNEYSTPNRVLTGIRMYLNKGNDPFSYSNLNNVEIFKVVKDNKQHVSEVKTGFFTAPKFFRGDNREMQLIVDCYIGPDHYVTTYTYSWVDSSPL